MNYIIELYENDSNVVTFHVDKQIPPESWTGENTFSAASIPHIHVQPLRDLLYATGVECVEVSRYRLNVRIGKAFGPARWPEIQGGILNALSLTMCQEGEQLGGQEILVSNHAPHMSLWLTIDEPPDSSPEESM